MKKYIVLISSIILVVPFTLMVIFAMFSIAGGDKFGETVLGNLVND